MIQVHAVVPELGVRDVTTSIAFYRDVLGFRLMSTAPEGDAPTWAELAAGTSTLMIQRMQELVAELPTLGNRADGGNVVIVLRIKDRATVRRLYEQMATDPRIRMPVRETDYETTEFALEDPDGHLVLLAGQR